MPYCEKERTCRAKVEAQLNLYVPPDGVNANMLSACTGESVEDVICALGSIGYMHCVDWDYPVQFVGRARWRRVR